MSFPALPSRAAAVRAGALALAVLATPAAVAGCLRPLQAPAAPTALNVVVQGDAVSGALVEFLRAVGARSGCEFRLPIYPRARLDRMFFSDEVDVLFPASRTGARDRSALFVPWVQLQPHLVTVRWNTERVADLRELLARPAWNAVVVRGYSWGDGYDAFIQELDRLGRVTYVARLQSVHAMLRAGHARFTLLPPSLLYASMTITRDGVTQPAGLPADFDYRRLPDLPPSLVGMYLNPRRVAPADIERLRQASSAALDDGELRRSLQRHYPTALLDVDMKALP
jgi:polar amino acid transport system substrate-binding protein